jgi:hypothetical protein
MKIELVIKEAFEKDMEQCRSVAPPFTEGVLGGGVPVFSGEKRGRTGYGFWLAAMAAALLIALFSLQTGIFQSSLVVAWAPVEKKLPKNPLGAFFNFLPVINSSL